MDHHHKVFLNLNLGKIINVHTSEDINKFLIFKHTSRHLLQYSY